MSDSGFVDEAPQGDGRPPRRHDGPGSAADDGSEPTSSGTTARRRSLVVIGFVVIVGGLVAFGTWAWAARVHADDVAAYEDLVQQVDVLDRSMTPLGHSEIPPCREATEGTLTRGYPPSTGPQAAELVGYLEQSGWAQQSAGAPVYARLTRTTAGHLLTIDVLAPSGTSLVGSLTARSAASSFGCLLR